MTCKACGCPKCGSTTFATTTASPRFKAKWCPKCGPVLEADRPASKLVATRLDAEGMHKTEFYASGMMLASATRRLDWDTKQWITGIAVECPRLKAGFTADEMLLVRQAIDEAITEAKSLEARYPNA